MTKCDHGFTLSAEIKLKDMNSTDKRYILSSGGDQVGASGLAVYLWHGDLICSTKKDNVLWSTRHKLDVNAGEWHVYQVSWNKKDGFIVYLDGKVFMSHSIQLPNPAQPTVYPLYIANAPNSTYSSTQMDVRNLFTWSASRDSLIGQGCITEYSTVPQSSSTHFSKIFVTISTTPTTTPVQSTTSDTTNWTTLLMMSSNKPLVLISTDIIKNTSKSYLKVYLKDL
ncbi:uncharacterized protein LOC134240828 [Saccostrea cucullata]|uniref:uncharacterized protein LOC134240828 n=1 Tax=Saccostrea cuccullata TaxID=36930 RepID=UPI002ED6128C